MTRTNNIEIKSLFVGEINIMIIYDDKYQEGSLASIGKLLSCDQKVMNLSHGNSLLQKCKEVKPCGSLFP